MIKKDETSVKGETGLSLYMLDWYFIDKYNLGFSIERDVYRRPKCGKQYTQEQLFLPQLNQYLKICPKDCIKIEEIEKEYNSSEYTEIERKIIGTIRNHTYENAIMAREVAEIVGCSTMKVAKFSEKMCKDSPIIKREKKNENVYRYFRGLKEHF